MFLDFDREVVELSEASLSSSSDCAVWTLRRFMVRGVNDDSLEPLLLAESHGSFRAMLRWLVWSYRRERFVWIAIKECPNA
jgi:hypothetical protein